MKNNTEDNIEKIIKTAVLKAGKILTQNFRKTGVKYTKEDSLDVVTEADLKANDLFLRIIKKYFPDHGIISEETGEYNTDSGYVWTIDPLDGTLNFSHGVPIFVTMLAVFKKKRLLMSAIYDPVHNELYFARKGRGATLNNKKIRRSKISCLQGSVGCLSSVFMKEQKKLCDLLVGEAKKITAITVGSAGFNGMCVARGGRDWFVNYNPRIWDIAPSILLLSEAGYKVTNIFGKPWKFGDQGIIAADKRLHLKLAELVKKSLT